MIELMEANMLRRYIHGAMTIALACHDQFSSEGSFRREILEIDCKLELPNEAFPKVEYARYYKIKEVFDGRGASAGTIVEVYLTRGYGTPGVYILGDNETPPNYYVTDGGCKIVRVIINMESKKVLYNECNAVR